jgi:hypothetical protein
MKIAFLRKNASWILGRVDLQTSTKVSEDSRSSFFRIMKFKVSYLFTKLPPYQKFFRNTEFCSQH